MKLLIANDNIFYRNENEEYFSYGQWRYTVWERYLKFFSNVTVAARVANLSQTGSEGTLDLSSGQRVSFLNIPSLSNPLSIIWRNKVAEEKLINALEEADVLIARLPSEIGFYAINIAQRLGKPWAVELVGCAWNSLWNHGKFAGKIYAPVAMFRTKNTLKKAKYVRYVTKDFLQKRYPSYGFIRNYSDVYIDNLNETVLVNRLDQIGHSPIFKIGMIGSMVARYKGIDTALKAISISRDKMPEFEFRIIGEGDVRPWENMVKKYGLSKQVKFCGTLPGGDPIYQWLDQIDLFLQPSRAEGLPRTLIEAMSRGCPALASTVGGIPELLDHSCLHKPKDVNALSNLIIHAANDTEWQKSNAKQNFSAAEQYTRQKIELKDNEFLQKLANC